MRIVLQPARHTISLTLPFLRYVIPPVFEVEMYAYIQLYQADVLGVSYWKN